MNIKALLVGLVLGVTAAFAQTKVDQGKPGTQGPWPVTIVGGTGGGGGGSGGSGTNTVTDAGVSVSVPYCSATASKNTTVGVASTAVPASPLAGRWLIRVCNSYRNSGTPIITCTSDGTTPTAASSSAGDTLGVGDCAQYTTGSVINCISDTASTAVTSEECK